MKVLKSLKIKILKAIDAYRPLSNNILLLYNIRVIQKRFFRYIYWLTKINQFSNKKINEKLPFRYYKHQSKLVKPLGGTDLIWQINKITNLKIAIKKINGIIILPGEFFSFHKLVGKPTSKKGYVEGMELSFGEARVGIGGCLCQMSNLIHWLILHTPLKIIERSNHSFDPFPDENRVLPFGSGAALFYNYIDLIFYNPTDIIFQINLWLTPSLLEGEIRASMASLTKYHIYETKHQFIERNGFYYRKNEIWRDTFTKGHDKKLLSSVCLYKNFARVKYKIT